MNRICSTGKRAKLETVTSFPRKYAIAEAQDRFEFPKDKAGKCLGDSFEFLGCIGQNAQFPALGFPCLTDASDAQFSFMLDLTNSFGR